jgi:hypothetical protein
MLSTTQLSLLALSAMSVSADLRWRGNLAQYNTFVRKPSNFAYAALQNQEKNNLDNFVRSNIDNEANQRNTQTEAAVDMLPCRNNQPGPMHTYAVGANITLPLQWNNPHSANCEVNVFINNYKDVIPLMRPSPCGGGYAQNDISFIIPPNFPGCQSEADKCVMQIYAHSVEPRTYAMCIDFSLTGGAPAPQAPASNPQTPAPYNPAPAPGNAPAYNPQTPAPGNAPAPASAPAGQVPEGYGGLGRVYKRAGVQGKLVQNLVPQPAIHYSDSYDTAHIDSTRSGYRGQQLQYLDPEVKAAIDLYSYIPNGGLLPTGEFNKAAIDSIKGQVANAITQAENAARTKNRAEQRALTAASPAGARVCAQGDVYGVVQNNNCNRQFTTTYVTNVGYQALLAEFKPKYEALGLKPYTPTTKPYTAALTTLADPQGSKSDAQGNRILPDGTVVAKPNANAAARRAAAQANTANAAKIAAAKANAAANANAATGTANAAPAVVNPTPATPQTRAQTRAATRAANRAARAGAGAANVNNGNAAADASGAADVAST